MWLKIGYIHKRLLIRLSNHWVKGNNSIGFRRAISSGALWLVLNHRLNHLLVGVSNEEADALPEQFAFAHHFGLQQLLVHYKRAIADRWSTRVILISSTELVHQHSHSPFPEARDVASEDVRAAEACVHVAAGVVRPERFLRQDRAGQWRGRRWPRPRALHSAYTQSVESADSVASATIAELCVQLPEHCCSNLRLSPQVQPPPAHCPTRTLRSKSTAPRSSPWFARSQSLQPSRPMRRRSNFWCPHLRKSPRPMRRSLQKSKIYCK